MIATRISFRGPDAALASVRDHLDEGVFRLAAFHPPLPGLSDEGRHNWCLDNWGAPTDLDPGCPVRDGDCQITVAFGAEGFLTYWVEWVQWVLNEDVCIELVQVLDDPDGETIVFCRQHFAGKSPVDSVIRIPADEPTGSTPRKMARAILEALGHHDLTPEAARA